MSNIILTDSFRNIFIRDRKCIINTDIDGIISGMLPQKFLNWKIVGYSSCCGKEDDELWLKDKNETLKDCVFVDLPVIVKDFSTIDQHFVAFDKSSVEKFNMDSNKINPNIMRNRVYKNDKGGCEYTSKYPFGTAHFVLAVLENLGIISDDYLINFKKKIESFDLADLILRADRVIGNTNQYTRNCIDWANWIIELGGKNTEALFVVVKNEYNIRINSEGQVEKKLLSYGCKGIDSDCSNLFRVKDYHRLENYFNFLGNALDMRSLPIYNVFDFNKLSGKRIFINNFNIDVAKSECAKNNIFSFAFVTMRALSLTYIEED